MVTATNKTKIKRPSSSVRTPKLICIGKDMIAEEVAKQRDPKDVRNVFVGTEHERIAAYKNTYRTNI